MQGSSLCNRRFVCLNAGNTPLKKYKYISVIGSLNAFSNLLNLFAPPPFRFYTIRISSRLWGIFTKKVTPYTGILQQNSFNSPFQTQPMHIYFLRYHDTPDQKILHNLVKHSFVLYFCQNSKKYQCRNLLH